MNDFSLILFFFLVLGAGLRVILFAISISIVLYGITETSYQKAIFERK